MSDQDTAPKEAEVPSPAEANDSSDLDKLAKLVDKITNPEGKPKYDSVEKAVESLPHKEQYIEKLKGENSELRAAQEELSNRLTAMETKNSLEDRIAAKLADSSQPEGTPPAVEIDEQTIGALVKDLMVKESTEAKKKAEANKFVEGLASHTKDVNAFIEEASVAKGLNSSFILDMAGQNAKAALEFLGVDVKTHLPEKAQSPINTAGFQGKPEGKPRPNRLFSKSSEGAARAAELLEQHRKA